MRLFYFWQKQFCLWKVSQSAASIENSVLLVSEAANFLPQVAGTAVFKTHSSVSVP